MVSQDQPAPSPGAVDTYEAEHFSDRASEDRASEDHSQRSLPEEPNPKVSGFRASTGLQNVARRTLGITLLLITVILWTVSNFLASYIFADNTYSKPYFVTYFNTAFFAISLIPIFWRVIHQHGFGELKTSAASFFRHLRRVKYRNEQHINEDGGNLDLDPHSSAPLLQGDALGTSDSGASILDASETQNATAMLSISETAVLSLEFCFLWFLANYFVAACLEYTSVASSTILTSTSSIWTLVFGALLKVELFTIKKLVGVLACLAGIIMISMVDLSGNNDDNRGTFPHKSQRQIAIGDILAFGSAVLYGAYSVIMKKRVQNEDRVNMPLFFGFVGLFNLFLLWPGFVILHYSGVETFELPPTSKVWTIIVLNSISSFVSDYTWAYAMLLTTPLVVTVGLSLTIPLSLVGQMILNSQYSSGLYWAGAVVMVLSFLFINHESHDKDDDEAPAA
ncbi:hypothetical protein O988_09240 [Pseudogymnoascus sp. VKM F-3808]|nr:hypothetical protein O988_09240 [Pseudogymnoascus sp. VKM F-3808]